MNPRQVQRLTFAVAVGAILLAAVMVGNRRAAPNTPVSPSASPALVTFELPQQPVPEMREWPLAASDPSLNLWRASNLTFVIKLPPASRERGFFHIRASSPDDTSMPDPLRDQSRDLSLIDFRVTSPSLD